MIDLVVDDGAVIGDEALATALERALTRHFRTGTQIAQIDRRLAAYHSSFRLEELDVVLRDGARLELMFKDVSRPLEKALRVKPAFLFDPQREVDAYRTILCAAGDLGTPVCYGTVANPVDAQYWLFIERVAGTRLRELGEFDLWEMAAQWLAALHVKFAPDVERLEEQTHLLKYNREHFAIWIDRAVELAGSRRTRQSIEWIARRYDTVIERLSVLPKTFIHGEFYPSNVLVRQNGAGPVVSPVDWEMAAVGPGLIDLAALASGWADADVDRLVAAYYRAANGELDTVQPANESSESFDCCRLHLAVQWLGWASGWEPPPEHVHNWLASAMRLAEKLNL